MILLGFPSSVSLDSVFESESSAGNDRTCGKNCCCDSKCIGRNVAHSYNTDTELYDESKDDEVDNRKDQIQDKRKNCVYYSLEIHFYFLSFSGHLLFYSIIYKTFCKFDTVQQIDHTLILSELFHCLLNKKDRISYNMRQQQRARRDSNPGLGLRKPLCYPSYTTSPKSVSGLGKMVLPEG